MDLQIFDFHDFKVRSLLIENEPWFVGRDVAEALGYSRATKAVQDHVDEDDKDEVPIQDSIGRMQNTPIINESGMYALIFGSKLDRAQEFKRWVTSEVLPSIRQTGMFATEELLDNPELLLSSLQRVIDERNLRKEAEKRVKELEPKSAYYDLVLQSQSLVSVTQIAKDFGKSPQWLNNFLHEKGIQYKQGNTWFLYQEYADRGYTQSYTYAVNSYQTVMNTKWTQKGRLFIYELLKEDGVLPVVERQYYQEGVVTNE